MSSDLQGPSDFINRLPTEIATCICQHLILCEYGNVSGLRLQSRFWNNVATPFLMNEIRVTFQPESLKRFIAVSQHPVISKHIKSLLYEANVLKAYPAQQHWENSLLDRDLCLRNISLMGSPWSTNRDIRTQELAFKGQEKTPFCGVSAEELAAAWLKHQISFGEEQKLRGWDFEISTVCEALARLPCLNSMRLYKEADVFHENSYWVKHVPSLVSGHRNHSLGVPQMKSLLLGASRVGLNLEHLEISSDTWKFLRVHSRAFEEMKSVLKNIKTLSLDVILDPEEEESLSEHFKPFDIEETETRLHDFLASAPELETLSLTLNLTDFAPIIRGITWPFLKTVSLGVMTTTDQEWLDFFKRHASTLENVRFNWIHLGSGLWWDVLETMRTELHLQSAIVRGELAGEENDQEWALDPYNEWDYDDMQSQANRTSKAIGDYLTQADSENSMCPLLDDEAHPEVY